MLQKILDWSEVWALLIPLFVIIKYPKRPYYLRPIKIYIWLALVIDICIDVIMEFKIILNLPQWLRYNNFLYNLHSIVRFLCFSYFFILLKQDYFTSVKKTLPFISLMFIAINFLFFEDFFYKESFSSRLLAIESGLLLFYCLQYYLFKLQDETTTNKRQPDFWIVTGLAIYVVFNFFYFLFYRTLLDRGYVEEVIRLWDFHNITYIILCIFIAKAFYISKNE